MKSSSEQLESRGFVPSASNLSKLNLSLENKLNLLCSKLPTERTVAARLLKETPITEEIVLRLTKALSIEKKLYPKLEISEALIIGGTLSVDPLLNLLGKIGDNQHKVVPERGFNKSNHPIPRDIAARILSKIGSSALPKLTQYLTKADRLQISEAVDAIGYICFYNSSSEIFPHLKELYSLGLNNELIEWKILRACSAFPESVPFLTSLKTSITNSRLLMEIDRSLKFASSR